MCGQSFKNTLRDNRCYVSLACSIGSISLACGSLLQIPNTTDRISLQRGFFLTSLGFIYFVSLTDFCNKYLLETRHGREFREKYRLMISDVMEITNKIVSAIQASFSFLVGFVVCKSTCSKSFVYASHFLMEAYGWFGTAYFMYDIWSMYKVHKQKLTDKLKMISIAANSSNGTKIINNTNGGLYDKHTYHTNGRSNNGLIKGNNGTTVTKALHSSQHENEIYDNANGMAYVSRGEKWGFLKYVVTQPVMMIHHIFIGTFGLLVVTYIRGGGHCIYSYMFMMEFSTPFVSFRGILSTMGLKETRIYIVNGLTMLGTFLIFRVLMWPYVMWRYSEVLNVSLWEAICGLPRGCIISILILFLPQIYWFFLMVKGALKVFFPSKIKKSNLQILQEQQQKQSKNNNLSPLNDNSLEFYKNGKLPTDVGVNLNDTSLPNGDVPRFGVKTITPPNADVFKVNG
ncbi:uncharacterized protein LOC119669564 [Teleopsis dalmanni]|uniref:uncharacterized protein LOC119669564 n=1 Tax=Teleopsis dalmanni TaxID=139649 RepID=UPI0018CD9F92|nr:uncharacterized protein LOC119669564 [Teleopsis dalmanni]XP_037935436.1 uncharacterized protein LOC119669564 [Teleopsis dalmanni]